MHEVGVDRADDGRALRQGGSDGGLVIDEPANLRARKVAVEAQARPAADDGLTAIRCQPPAEVVAAAILPDDRPPQRCARAAVEDDERLSLIGQAYAGELVEAVRLPPGDGSGHAADVFPDLRGVVLGPLRLRSMLGVRSRLTIDDRARVIEQHGLCGRGALVDGEEEGHG